MSPSKEIFCTDIYIDPGMPDISGIADLLFTERFSLLFIENSIADYGKKDRNLAMNGNRKPENG